MQRYIEYKRELIIDSINIANLAYIILFFAETSYYLLILQTGIIEHFHSDLSKIWMIPIGGILGILSIYMIKNRLDIISIALFIQTLIMFYYPYFDGLTLFILGFLSGLIAPYLIYQLKSLEQVITILALAYIFGTFSINIPADNRGYIAIFLSILALLSSYFTTPIEKRVFKNISIKNYINIFIWLVLDATLFETLSRSSYHIWANSRFTLIIAIFHTIGLYLGYRLSNYRYTNRVIIGLFILSYLLFIFKFSYLLAMVYPIVISYYNVIILKYFMNLTFGYLVLVSLGLWGSAGIGLFMALFHYNLI